MNFAASWFTHLLRPASLLALLNGSDQILQPSRASTSRLSAGRSPFLPLDMTTAGDSLYGAFFVKNFQQSGLTFFLRQFLCSI